MLQKIKKFMAVGVIVLLFPYVITLFFNGRSVETSQNPKLDEYCIHMLAREVSSDYEEELLKAQAVIVRTTVYKNVKEIDFEAYESMKLDPVWYQKLKKVWKETEGQVLMYQGELALLPFHRLSNGKTRDGKEVFESDAYPYLQSKDCFYDLEAKEQVQIQKLDVQGATIQKIDSQGYVLEVKSGEEVCSGDQFREAYDLRSSCYEIKVQGEETFVVTKGVGHGVGLSQYTANALAKQGRDYQEILAYFFEGTEMQEVAQILWEIE